MRLGYLSSLDMEVGGVSIAHFKIGSWMRAFVMYASGMVRQKIASVQQVLVGEERMSFI